jgi:hypothetical protein
LPSEWPIDAQVDRAKIDRARKNAEDLFKPKAQLQPVGSAAPAEDPVSSADSPPRRQPRIFRALPAVPTKTVKIVAPAQPKPSRRRSTVGRDARVIPASQFGRIRALTQYGMTEAQVAELYDVSVGEIEWIVRRPGSNRPA